MLSLTKVNKFLKTLCLLLVCFSLVSSVAAKSKLKNKKTKKSEFHKFIYVIKKNDTFASIIKKFVKSDSIINANSKMVKKTIKKNKHIKNWKKLKPGRRMFLLVSRAHFSKKKVRKLIKNDKSLVWVGVTKRDTSPKGLHFSAFYMASSGTFNQQSEDSAINISFNQNSLISLGVTGIYSFLKKPFSISSSLYFSTLQTPTNGSGEIIEIPLEMGINSYFQHSVKIKKFQFSYYGGFDYESFSTFNTGLLRTSSDIVVNTNNVLYFTAGFSKFFKISKSGLFTKISFSQSLLTKTQTGLGGVSQVLDYSGYKAMFYMNYKVHKKWFIHALYKQHSMTGDDKLTTSRIGAGFGYILN